MGQDLGDIDGLSVVAIDGKVLRHSNYAKSFNKMVHTVSAFSVANEVVLGVKLVDEKPNEILVISEFLKQLTLTGMITIDAIGAQKEIAEQIINLK